jgi:hypothetical protein
MSDRTAVSDSTPLIYLARIGRLEILRKVYGRVIIPRAVYEEVVQKGKERGLPDAYIVERTTDDWLEVLEVDPETEKEYGFVDSNPGLGRGEREAIKLCKQVKASFFIADDREARRAAGILNITTAGTCGTVIQGHRMGFCSNREAKEIIDDLVGEGLRIGTMVYRRVLEELRI